MLGLKEEKTECCGWMELLRFHRTEREEKFKRHKAMYESDYKCDRIKDDLQR